MWVAPANGRYFASLFQNPYLEDLSGGKKVWPFMKLLIETNAFIPNQNQKFLAYLISMPSIPDSKLQEEKMESTSGQKAEARRSKNSR